MSEPIVEATVGPSTKVTIASAVAVVGAFLGGATWIQNSLSKVETGQQEVRQAQTAAGFRLDMIDYRLETLEKRSDDKLRSWVREFRAANPALPIPSVE